jgi:hypothetical protein
MCTVSVVPAPDGFRLIANRDERRARPPALPPRAHWCGDWRAVWPIDPQGGGTWTAVNEVGLAAALLNRRTPSRAAGGRWLTTRGVLVPRVMNAGDLQAALDRLAWTVRIPAFAPFSLLLVWRDSYAVATYDGELQVTRAQLRVPIMLTTSSLGDEVVDGPRSELFTRMVVSSDRPFRDQRCFHAHQWAERPHVSVRMSRPDAATVSVTSISVGRGDVRLAYTPVRDSQ